MDVTVKNVPLRGHITAPPSKSDAHRALIFAALADAPTEIGLGEIGEDIAATIRCLTALGTEIERQGGSLLVTPASGAAAQPLFDCGESGSTLRFLLPVAAAISDKARFIGSGKLPQRPIGPLVSSLRAGGCAASSDTLPLELTGRLKAGVFELPGNVSSQFVSGLLMALPLLNGLSRIVISGPLESAAYADMTVSTLTSFGIELRALPDGYEVDGIQAFRSPGLYAVESDWSGAAFFMAANALGGSVEISGLNYASLQPDRAILELTRALPDSLDVSGFPDLFPVLSIMACAKRTDTLLHGAARLRLKESDRIRETARLIRDLGGSAQERDDALLIHGSGRLRGGITHSAGDHRIAMSAAVAAAICDSPVTIQGAEAADKSFPSFWEALSGLAE